VSGPPGFSFRVLARDPDSRARTGRIETRRGPVDTPCLVPVATAASVRALSPDDLEALGVPCVLANTFHLHLRPGDENIRRLGGLHEFMAFPGPILTDSGGFQAFSLGFAMEHGVNKLGTVFPGGHAAGEPKPKLAWVTDEGVRFRSPVDGSELFLDPELSMRIQANLGAEIIMAFDECTSPLSDRAYTAEALERTHRWAEESLEHHDGSQALFGIVQGGWFEDLRRASAEFIAARPFPGIAIGGSLGRSKEDMHAILDWVVPMLDDRPRHLLGIGEIEDLFDGTARGIDTFDCVNPTRIARRGTLFLGPRGGGSRKNRHRLNIRRREFAEDAGPIDPSCSCPACRSASRAYLRHLFLAKEASYLRLATLHNVHFVLRLMESVRQSIREGRFGELRREWLGPPEPAGGI
jgi:tRNA-guanine transglycosylase